MSKRLLAVLVGIALVCPSIQIFAQEEDVEYSWCVANSVSSDQILVTEYDYDTEEEIEAVYYIDPEIKLEGVNALKEIVAGDYLDIAYVVEDGKKIAKVISVEKSPLMEEEEEDWDYGME